MTSDSDVPFRNFLRDRIDTVPQEVVDATIRLWDRLQKNAPGIPLPVSMANKNDGGSLSMTWKTNEVTLSVEIFGTEKCEWFFRDHNKNTYGGVDTAVDDGFPDTSDFREIMDHVCVCQ